MYKLMFWSISKGKLLIFMFGMFEDLMVYLYKIQDDIELEKHFIKIVKENTEE